MDTEELKEKVARFSERKYQGPRPIVFCVNCGSTKLDQTGAFQIQCCECRQTGLWNGREFAICRKGYIREAAGMLSEAAQRVEEDWSSWDSQALLEIIAFGKFIHTDCYIERFETSAKKSMKATEYKRVKKTWEELKEKMDKLIG